VALLVSCAAVKVEKVVGRERDDCLCLGVWSNVARLRRKHSDECIFCGDVWFLLLGVCGNRAASVHSEQKLFSFVTYFCLNRAMKN
jgi:hypothetical protein